MSTSNTSSLPPQQASVSLSIPARARLSRELSRLQQDPPPGIAAFLETDDNLSVWRAEIVGPPESPFQEGVFELMIRFPPRYPMEPPNCRFTSNPAPYHPNIDSSGRICLDTLKSAPSGTWSPAVSLSSLLLSLRSLLAEPNPDDGLVADISQQYRLHPEQWRAEAKRQTEFMMANNDCKNTEKRLLGSTEKEEAIVEAEPKRRKQSPSE
jgi:ubiquitin-conjugating enzyme E2 T